MENYGRIKAVIISEGEKELHQKKNIIKVQLLASAVKITYLLQTWMMDFTKIVMWEKCKKFKFLSIMSQ